MSFNPEQLRTLIRRELLALNDRLLFPSAVELLMLTAAQETYCGRWLWQFNGNPEETLRNIPDRLAYGIFQMEEPAYRDAVQILLRYKPNYVVPSRKRLITDLQLAVWCARCYYARFIEPIPDADDIWGLAEYWKRYWNTPAGSGTAAQAARNYWKYAL